MTKVYAHRGSVVVEYDNGDSREITSKILDAPIPGVMEAIEELSKRVAKLKLEGEGDLERPNSILVCLGARRVANRASEMPIYSTAVAVSSIAEAHEVMLNHVRVLQEAGKAIVAQSCSEYASSIAGMLDSVKRGPGKTSLIRS